MKHLENINRDLQYFCNQSPVPMLAITIDGCIVGANESAHKLLHKGANSVGFSLFNFIEQSCHEQLAHSFEHIYQNLLFNQTIEIEVKTIQKTALKMNASLKSMDEQTFIFICIEDITSQKQRDSFLELNQAMLNMIVKRESIHHILDRLSMMIENYIVRETYCSIVLINQKRKINKIVAPKLPIDYTQTFFGVEIGEIGGSCGTAMSRNETVIVSDIMSDSLWEGNRDQALAIGIRACWSVPILIDNEVIGSFAIYHPTPSTPTNHELEMIETCANLVGLAIERDQEEKRLIRETEKRFKLVMDLIPDLIVFKDKRGHWIEGNQTAKEKLPFFHDNQVKVKEPHYKQYEEYLLQVEETDRLAWQSGTPIRRELILPQANGEEEIYDILKVPFHDDPVIGNGLIVIGREITKRKKTEKLLERNEQQFKSLFDHNPNGICMMDSNGNIIMCNRSLERLLGYSFSELQQNCGDYIDERDEERIKQYFTKALSGESNCYEVAVKHKTGNKVYLKVSNVPIIVQGTVIGVYGIAEDITQKTKSEEKLNQTKKFLESLIYHSADCITTAALDGKILHVNPAIENVYGWKMEKVIGKRIPSIPNEKIDELKQIITKIKQGKDIIGIETKRRKKDGTIIDVSITYSPLRDEAGQIIGFTAVSRDISDRKRTDELLKRSDKLSVIGQLSAAVAHEIRNPLTSIKGFIQLFRDRIEKEYTDLMLSELERIEVIVTEFLSLAKPQANHFLEKDPKLLLKNTLAIIDTEALLNQIEIHSMVDQNVPTIYCNEHKIKQVLINILKNAIESMPSGGKLQIKMTKVETSVVTEVIDQGCGIPKEKIKKLGEPFYSSKDHGTGLGLMVCFKIIEEHKGNITIESEEGIGTKVTISLPVFDNYNQ